ncbi:hypothetical protein C8R43DRAFT_1039051 [Mycena crocata]|nr:hypothetical protein C8R43DRAFT_1039051 [Mycena crocata]
MHPALEIQEIVHAIFSQVELSPFSSLSDGPGEVDLASAAGSCRQLSGPALDRLWSRMWNLKPLLALLSGVREENGIIILLGQVHPKEWSRFTSYAARIRTLYHTNNLQGEVKIDGSVFAQIGQLSQGQPLFPRLQQLFFTATWLPVPELLLFQTENLVHLYFVCEDTRLHDYSLASYLASTPEGCQLRELSFSGPTSQLALASISKFPLQRLSISKVPWNIDTATISIISRLDNLTNLSLDVAHLALNGLHNYPEMCPALQNLSLDGSIRNMASFLQAVTIASKDLRSISLVQRSYDNTLQVEQLSSFVDAWVDALRAASRYSDSLQRVTLTGYYAYQFPPNSSVRGMRLLEPLMKCSRIEDLFLCRFPPVTFTDTDVALLASSWPALVVANLPTSPPDGTPSAASLHAFAKHCPRLDQLSFSVHTRDASAQALTLRDLEPGAHMHGLHLLVIVGQPVGSPAADVAALLCKMFPRLGYVGSRSEEDTDVNRDSWKEVDRLVKQSAARNADGKVPARQE